MRECRLKLKMPRGIQDVGKYLTRTLGGGEAETVTLGGCDMSDDEWCLQPYFTD